MKIRHIVMANLRRRLAKSLFLAAGVGFSFIAVAALITLATSMEKQVIRSLTGITSVVVSPRSGILTVNFNGVTVPGLKISYGSRNIAVNEVNLIKEEAEKAGAQAVIPKLLQVEKGVKGKFLVVVTDIALERKLHPYWQVEGRSPGQGEVLVGSRLAAKEGVKIGGQLQVGGKTYTVSGIITPTGREEDDLVFVNYRDWVAGKSAPGGYHLVEVVGEKQAVERLAGTLTSKLPELRITSPRKALEQRREVVQRFVFFAYGVAAVMVLAAGLLTFISVTAAVRERYREIGLLRAMGYRRHHLLKIILGEVACLTGIAGGMGVVWGTGAAYFLLPYLAGEKIPLAVSPWAMVGVVFLPLLTGIAAAIGPAWRAANIDPAEALRNY